MKKNLFSQISSIKQRNDIMMGNSHILSLKEVKESFEKICSVNKITEIIYFEYIPVAIVVCFQSFFRSVVLELISKEESYLSNSMKLNEVKNFRLEIRDLLEINSSKISTVEIIAHNLSFNNIDSINNVFSIILNIDFFDSLNNFYPAKPNENFKNATNHFVNNKESIFRDIASTYKLRHIYCHEFKALIQIEISVIFRYLKNCIAFLEAVEVYFNHIIYPYRPISKKLKENTRLIERKKFFETEKDLDKLVQEIISIINGLGYEVYFDINKEIEIWRKYRNSQVKQLCEVYEGSRTYKETFWRTMEGLTGEKIGLLKNCYRDEFEMAEHYDKIEKFI